MNRSGIRSRLSKTRLFVTLSHLAASPMPSFLLDLSPSHQQQEPVETRSTASTRRNRKPSSLSDDPFGNRNLPLTSS